MISAYFMPSFFNKLRKILYKSVMPEPGGPPKYLADQLTLFQPGEGILFPPIDLPTYSPSQSAPTILDFENMGRFVTL